MGRHTRFEDDETPADHAPRRSRMGMVSSVPLLPVLALVVAIGVVAYAVSTQQISLNFGNGGSPGNLPQADAGNGPAGRGVRDRASRGGARPDGVVIAFRATGRLPSGFKGAVAIANRGARPVNGWILGFKIPNAQVLSVGDATLTRTGTAAWVRNPPAAPVIRPGQTVRLTFVARGAAARPSVCVFNRLRCQLV